MIRRRIAERRIERRPGQGEPGVVVGVRFGESRQHRLASGIASLGLVKFDPTRGSRGFERRTGCRERFHRLQQRLAALQHGQPFDVEALGHDHDLQRAGFRLAALEVGDDELGRDHVGRLHAFRGEIPRALQVGRHGSFLDFEIVFLPRPLIHFHHLHDLREAHIVTRVGDEFHQFVRRRDEVLLRSRQVNGRHQVRRGAQLVLRAELVFKARLRGDQMHAVGARRRERDARGQPAFGQRQGNGRRGLAAIHAQFAAFHGLVRGDLQLDLGADHRGEGAVVFLHHLGRHLGVGRKMVGLLEGHLVRTRDGGECVVAGAPVARLHAITHRLARDLDGRGKAIGFVRIRNHVRNMAARGVTLRFQPRCLRHHALQLHLQPHRITLRHRLVAGIRFNNDKARIGNRLQIGPRHERPQE